MDNGNFNNGYYDPNGNNQQPQFGQQPQFNQQPMYGQQPAYGAPQAPTPGKGLAIASMVLGIVSLILCCIYYIAIPTSITGLILGIIAVKKAKNPMATAGIITSAIAIVLLVIYLGLACLGCAMMKEEGNDAYNEMMEEIYGDALEDFY